MSIATVGDWNAAVEASPIADAERLIGPGGLIVLSPHPDDETLGASALLVAAGRLGRAVGLVAVTDGDASHPASRLFPPARMAELRAREQAAAMEVLGCPPTETLRLGLPDGGSGRDPRFSGAAETIAALCQRLGATALAAPHPDDPHPDHHASAALALAVRGLLPDLRILFYEVWSRRLPPEAPFSGAGLTPFRVRTDVELKRQAIDCHASQLGRVVTDDPGGFAMPPWFLDEQNDDRERYAWLAMPGEVPGAAHFDRLYAGGGDPWHAKTSPYEAEKRQASVGALAGRRYRRALDIGCGEGLLTRLLLETGAAETVVGVDGEPAIVARATAAAVPGASFVTGRMPGDLPPGPFDLVVLSEVLYFLDERNLAALVDALSQRLEAGAGILVVSYLGPTDTPLGGRAATDVFAACLGEEAVLLSLLETPDYRIEHFEWRGAPGAVPADGP